MTDDEMMKPALAGWTPPRKRSFGSWPKLARFAVGDQVIYTPEDGVSRAVEVTSGPHDATTRPNYGLRGADGEEWEAVGQRWIKAVE